MKAADVSATRLLTMLMVLGFVLELALGDAFGAAFALWPLHYGFLPWQLLTYAFLHADLTHLAFNLLGLWMFGRVLEAQFGPRMLLAIFFASVLSAATVQMWVSSASGAGYPTVGASGGVFGLLLAFGVCFPKRIVILLLPPLPLPAWLAVTLYAGIELVLGVAGSEPGVAHFAHLGGMIGAYLALRRWRRADA